MKFNFIDTDNLKEDFLKRHNLDLDKYNDYDFTINESVIDDFYSKLIECKNDKFLIVGDYDCDGICSTTIIKNLFNSLNISHSYYIPSRLHEGYGLNKLIVDNAIKHHYNSIFLVDNGVSCHESIEYAYQNNIKVFIIDHHNYSDLPRCEAIIHQNLLSKEYEYASAGMLCFLFSLKYSFSEFNLVLGALTILSDYILINSFNRFLIKKMYDYLNENEYISFNLLNEGDTYTNTSITFNIIPKINSVSRMETGGFNANHLVKFLLGDYKDLGEISRSISSLNNKRKKDTSSIFNSIIKKQYDGNYILICDQNINEGYCSSLATKLSNYYDKPVFILSKNDGVCKGSARSQGLDLYNLIKDYDKYLSFGGHSHAVGLNIKEDDLIDFETYLDSLDYSNIEESTSDAYVIDPNLIDAQLIEDIDALGPFGNGYEAPLIAIINEDFDTKIIKDKYTKFFVNDNLSCITFDEKYIGYKPEYIIGSITKDTFNKGAFSLIIKYLV